MLNNINGNTIKIAAIGDSITYGYPYGPKGSWFDLAAGQYHIAYVNRGVNGDTTAGMRRRFARDVLMQEVTHVIVMGGTNDAYAGLGVNEVMHHIRAMTELALEKGIVPIIGLPIPCNIPAQEKLLDQYREEMRRYAMDNNMGWIDFYTSMVEEDGVTIKTGLYRDAVHPNKAGYQVMTAVFAKFIQ
jgi:lysophospholipase L1-like esterase